MSSIYIAATIPPVMRDMGAGHMAAFVSPGIPTGHIEHREPEVPVESLPEFIGPRRPLSQAVFELTQLKKANRRT